jgi:hypothetical protein
MKRSRRTHFFNRTRHPLFGFLIGAAVLLACAGCNEHGKKLKFGKGEIYYKKGVTKAEAQSVGKYLVKAGFFNDKKAKSVQLLKEGDTYQIKFVVKDPNDMAENLKKQFRLLGGMVAHYALDGAKVEVHLCDRRLKTKATLDVPKSLGGFGKQLSFGRGEVYYKEPVKKELAQKLGKYLKEKNYFTDKKRKSVQILKQDGVFHLRIVFTKKNISPKQLQLMNVVGKNLAANIFGGQKLKISLCDESLQCFKTLGPF